MTPWLDDGDLRLYHGDAQDVLAELPDSSVDCVVTSPPYWGLRDYGIGQWEGGNPDCDHLAPPGGGTKASGLIHPDNGLTQETVDAKVERIRGQYRTDCGKCGARRVDNQLGLEPTPDQYVANMVDLFREVRRVLAPHGTCWVNLGDSYAQQGAVNQGESGQMAHRAHTRRTFIRRPPEIKPKDLVGIPWRVAFALQQDGWYLRSDIIWSKPNPMPESVTDRPTKAHEYVFLLTRQPRYWFDAEAVREPSIYPEDDRKSRSNGSQKRHPTEIIAGIREGSATYPSRNIRSVWQIATQPYPEAHFATYPEELARRCILAGCPTRVCRECGKPSERIVDRESVSRPDLPRDHPEWHPARYDNGKAGDPQSPGPGQRFTNTQTLGWTDCGCVYNALEVPAREDGNWRPGVVLDPFIGSGTTALVARNHQRHSIGIDLSESYLELAARRLQQLSLLT